MSNLSKLFIVAILLSGVGLLSGCTPPAPPAPAPTPEGVKPAATNTAAPTDTSGIDDPKSMRRGKK